MKLPWFIREFWPPRAPNCVGDIFGFFWLGLFLCPILASGYVALVTGIWVFPLAVGTVLILAAFGFFREDWEE